MYHIQNCHPNCTIWRQSKRTGKYNGIPYNEEELKQLLALAQDDQIYVVIALSAYLGLRRSEALGLMWDCVDFERNLIRIEHKVVEYYNPKTKASELLLIVALIVSIFS